MKKSISNIKGIQKLTTNEQKTINGAAGVRNCRVVCGVTGGIINPRTGLCVCY